MAARAINKGVTLYTAGTPNGWKISILLKELKYPHSVKQLSFSKNEQKEEKYLKINPNGRIPAIVDHDNGDFPVFESGAIMMYLAEKAGQLYPEDWNKRSEVNQWLFFMNAGVGPMQGQANHFVRYAPEAIPYAQNRYVNETYRLYSVLDGRLKEHEWLAADEYSIADIATFSWIYCSAYAGLSLEEYPSLAAWVSKIKDRDAVSAGLDVPEPNPLKEPWSDTQKMKDFIAEAKNKLSS
eukprot:jgi/Ulvmu1/6228/UM028_0086.1